ncbi:MAG: GNAT family acetyltransferase [Candidatus Marinimicrobia bacterium]|nr:GNAT family acetyltransferase [Candidatus Neomarinimicrobiota bacterium]
MVKVKIRKFHPADAPAVIDLWRRCELVVPWNDPRRDINRKLADSPDLFFVGENNERLLVSCMAGYDGHRGWIYYLAVDPDFRRRGLAAQLMQHAEAVLKLRGCPKIDLMVRDTNQPVIDFYHRIGYKKDPVLVLSKRLINDD